MGKKIIPPSDPERLARVMDEKARMMGIEVGEISRQTRERQEAETAAVKLKMAEDARQLQWAQEIERAHIEASIRRRRNAARIAEYQKHQNEEKKGRDVDLRGLYQNHVGDEFFTQFGTSHR